MAGGKKLGALGLGKVAKGMGTGQQAGTGVGSTGGAGLGEGGVPGEDPSTKTGFVPQRSRSAITAGRILMKLKTEGVASGGRARVEHDEALRQVQQGVSEAILKENVPPSYHEAIKGYFDELGRSNRPNEKSEKPK